MAVGGAPVRCPGREGLGQLAGAQQVVAVVHAGAVCGSGQCVRQLPAVKLPPPEAPLAVHGQVVVPVLQLPGLPMTGGEPFELIPAVDDASGAVASSKSTMWLVTWWIVVLEARMASVYQGAAPRGRIRRVPPARRARNRSATASMSRSSSISSIRMPVCRSTSTVAQDQNAASSSWVRFRRLPATSVT